MLSRIVQHAQIVVSDFVDISFALYGIIFLNKKMTIYYFIKY